MLTAASEYHQLSELIARRAVAQVGAAKNDRARVAQVQVHQMAAAQASQNAFQVMLEEQRINARAEQLLNTAAFTTETDSMLAMLDTIQDDMGMDRLVASLVQDAGRAADTVGVVARPRIAHVRYLNPPSCSRCAVLAGRAYRWSTGFLRHPGCDCIMIPTTTTNDQFLHDPVELMKQGQVTGLSKFDREAILMGEDFNQVINRHRTGLGAPGRVVRRAGQPTIEEVLASTPGRETALKRLGEIAYTQSRPGARPAASGGGSGRNIPPRAPSPIPDPEDWAARQAALATNTNGEQLKPHEVEFLERFERRGEVTRWIPTSEHMLPTNDFVWRSNGNLVTELKSTKAKFTTIRGRIESAARKAETAGAVKENFIIDLGDEVLSDELRTELRGYNTGRRRYRISRLWVMSEDGRRFEEIDLRA